MSDYKGEDMVSTRELLTKDPTAKWGFIIYRCTYADDTEWARFMQYLNTRTRLELEDQGDGDLFERIDWQVQDDREKFDDVGPRTLREHFVNEVLPTLPRPMTSRHRAFVTVNQFQLNLILNKAPPAEEFDVYGKGFVTLISEDRREGFFNVGLSYLVPRVYTLLDGCGWDNVCAGQDGVVCP